MSDSAPDQQYVSNAWADLRFPEDLSSDQAVGQLPEFLQLRRLSYVRTLAASVLGCIFIFLGLIILCLGESRMPAVSSPAVLGFRVMAWLILYQLPVQTMAIASVRSLAMHGIEPGAWLCISSKGQTLGARLVLMVLHGSSLLVFVLLTCAPFHPQHQFLGFAFIYGVGHCAAVFMYELFLPRVIPCRHARYGFASGPPTLGVAIIGFSLLVSCFAIGKRILGDFFGGSVAVFLFLYENLGTHAICSFYTEKFIKDLSVREAYIGSAQAITPSIAIALITCMAEGARVTVLITGAMFDPEDNAWKVALGATLVVGLVSRAGYLDACYSAWKGARQVSNGRLLLRHCRFQSGYPRILLLGSLGIVRFALGVELSPNSTVTKVVLFTLLETLLEDLLIVGMKHMGLTYEPQPVPYEESQPSTVVPEVKSEEDSRRSDTWLFQYGFGDLPELPLWAQFAPVMISQFHTVLFLFIFCGGVSTALGLCDNGYTGLGRGILWWPIEEDGHLCD